ncbi:MAG: AgmX/PglI C-terminal domain-containing protein [Kofleriaceae bacterium]
MAALLGDSVIGVKHCIDPHSGTIARTTWALLAASAISLIAGASAVGSSIHTAATNKAALDQWRAANRPAYAFRPSAPLAGGEWVAFGGLGLGLVGAVVGLARLRRERRSPYYRIGTAPGVEQPLEHAPAPAFPLVAPSGDRFVLNFGPGLDGELIHGGQVTALPQLVADGRATPSNAIAGAFELPIGETDRIRVRAGKTTFVVAGMPAPKPIAAPAMMRDGRALKYAAGSLVFHMALLAVLSNIYDEDSGIGIELRTETNVATRSVITINDMTPPEPDDSSDELAGEGTSMPTLALAEGESGNPASQNPSGRQQVKNTKKPPALTKDQAVRLAMNAGILGARESLAGIHSLTSFADYSSGFSDVDIYGPVFGADGEGHGSFGGGVRGFGPGGGCSTPPCGTIATGRYATIPGGPGNGPGGWGSCVGPSCKGGLRMTRVASVPQTKYGPPRVIGEYDKTIVRRYIQRNAPKLAYCYEHQLLASPGIAGEIVASFFISPNGTVQASNAAGFDNSVASCVADVIKNIEFPKPGDGGVQVKYPFTFRAAAG